MLEAASVPFEVVEAPFDETSAKSGLVAAGFEARDLVEMLAELKARSVAAPADALILGADQTLELASGAMLSKPASLDDASEQLHALSGRLHFLHSGAVLLRDGERVWGHTETVSLKMRMLSESFIRHYLEQEYDSIRWSVGGYRIEGAGAQLFEEIEGSHFAILGLPLLPLLAQLREFGLLES